MTMSWVLQQMWSTARGNSVYQLQKEDNKFQIKKKVLIFKKWWILPNWLTDQKATKAAQTGPGKQMFIDTLQEMERGP